MDLVGARFLSPDAPLLIRREAKLPYKTWIMQTELNVTQGEYLLNYHIFLFVVCVTAEWRSRTLTDIMGAVYWLHFPISQPLNGLFARFTFRVTVLRV